MTTTLQYSVGRGGANRFADVKAVQTLLSLPEDGHCTGAMIEKIEAVQRAAGFKTPDGRVDPGGRTLAWLNTHAIHPGQPAAQAKPLLILDIPSVLSAWQAKFKDVRRGELDGLAEVLGFMAQDPLLDNSPADLQRAAYMLATFRHETAFTFKPIDEHGGPDYFKRMYGPATRAGKSLGNLSLEDAVNFHGRGYVQLTGRANYGHLSELLDIPLLGNPELAKEPAIAYAIATLGMHNGLFTGHKLEDYIRPGKEPMFTAARRIINGSDKASLIAGYAFTALQILQTH